MLESQLENAPLSRAEGKRRSRQKLITATLNSIAKRGFTETTLARVAEGAGLSRGIVNFHFRTKNALFLEALKFMARDYREHWARALDEAGPTAAEKLEAVLMADFDPPTSNRNRIAAWFAYYGEAKSSPTYMAACAEVDLVNYEAIIAFCRTIIEEGAYPYPHPVRIAEGLEAMSEGLWLDILVSPQDSSPELSKQTVNTFLEALFPKHFPIVKSPGD
jgi:TetR/AcrR family transcriptional repressor of bet genes